MSSSPTFPADQLAPLADSDCQRSAARLAQDAFGGLFRLAVEAAPENIEASLRDIENRCANWCQAGASEAARALRTALLVGGLDQWGLAYAQAFRLTAIPALSALLGALRSRLDARTDALFQQYHRQLEAVESDGADFKIELRRNLHLALWHAMAACPSEGEAQDILKPLGGMLLALDRQWPELGWRLVADTLAHIQIGLLGDARGFSSIARDSTQQLFDALRQALPAERQQLIMRQASQVMLAWQQARRGGVPN